MSHAIRKTANAISGEKELRNAYDELKDLLRCCESRIKQQEEASKALVHWAKRKEDKAIEDFLNAISDVEIEMTGVDRLFNDQFRLFSKCWKSILAEKKELNTKVAQLKRVRSQLEDAQKRVFKGEEKKDEAKMEKYRAQLQEIEANEQEEARGVAQKLLEVQQDKHEMLREAYSNLYTANLAKFKELIAGEEKIRIIVNNFNKVSARNDDGTFVLVPYDGPKLETPIWCQGEALDAMLAKLKKEHEQELKNLTQKHSASLKQAEKEKEELQSRASLSYSEQMRLLDQEHKDKAKAMQESFDAEKAALEKRIADLEAEYAKAMEEAKARFDHAAKELEKKKAEIVNLLEEEAKLEDKIEAMRIQIAARGLKQDHATISAMDLMASPMESFFKVVSLVESNLNDIVQLMPMGVCTPEDFYEKFTPFARLVVTCLFHAACAVRASHAENSGEMLPLCVDVQRHMINFFNVKKFGEVMRRTSVIGDASMPPFRKDSMVEPDKEEELPKYVALYDHQGNQQDGFTLMTFKTGDVLEMIKTREDGWSKVQMNGQVGWAPTAYLSPYAPPSSSEQDNTKEVFETIPEELTSSDTAPPLPLDIATGNVKTSLTKLIAFARVVYQRDKELKALNDALVDTIAGKVSAAKQAILDALKRLDKLLEESKGRDKDRHLEVNQNILTLCKKEMSELKEVVDYGEVMRENLENTKSASTAENFSSMHASWFEGLNKAVETIADGQPMMMEGLRSVVTRKGKHEELQVAIRNISASIAQLMSLSRTKKVPNTSGGEDPQAMILKYSDMAITTSHDLLEAVRESQDLAMAAILMEDLDNLSENQAKRLMMATQVNVLKLESELAKEREKLGRLRRLHYFDDSASTDKN